MSITEQIKNIGKENGLDIIKITDAEAFPRAEKSIIGSIEKGYIPSSKYSSGDDTSLNAGKIYLNKISERCNPKNILKNAKSIITVAQYYLIEEDGNFGNCEQPCGKIAKYDIANFYYEVKEKLKSVIDFINQKTDGKYKSKNKSCYVSLVEKPIAQRAGVGWYGKNGVIITEDFGSWVVLGEIITELELDKDDSLQNNCGSCRTCMDACPTKAIVSPYVIDRTKCLQYISERLIDVPVKYREVWGDNLYGCTICQDVCPKNRNKNPKKYLPKYGYIGSRVPLIPLLEMTEEEFTSYFSDNQIAMRPMKAIKRNAILALGNIGDSIAIPHLIKVLQEDDQPMIRGYTAWALGKLGSKRSRNALEKALKIEESENVKEEIMNALRML